MTAAAGSTRSGPAYYPGCSLDGMGRPYELSAQAVLHRLGLPLERIVEYNCCGATEVKNISPDLSLVLPARNLALAEAMGRSEVVAACNGCLYSLARANEALVDPAARERINARLREGGAPPYGGATEVRHLLDYIYRSAGVDAVRAAVVRPLKGIVVAPYYGCMYTRPKQFTRANGRDGHEDPQEPMFLDELLAACGATVVREYEAKTICCGGGHALSDLEVSVGFSAAILHAAQRAGADLVATICPLGQINIENHLERIAAKYGPEIIRPAAYFTQLMALAFGSTVRAARLADNFSRPDRLFRARGYP